MTNPHIEKAAELAPIISSVHGEHHPELSRVNEITQELTRADTTTDTRTLFEELRTITNDYAIPDDVCETFEGTYHALERADRAAREVLA